MDEDFYDNADCLAESMPVQRPQPSTLPKQHRRLPNPLLDVGADAGKITMRNSSATLPRHVTQRAPPPARQNTANKRSSFPAANGSDKPQGNSQPPTPKPRPAKEGAPLTSPPPTPRPKPLSPQEKPPTPRRKPPPPNEKPPPPNEKPPPPNEKPPPPEESPPPLAQEKPLPAAKPKPKVKPPTTTKPEIMIKQRLSLDAITPQVQAVHTSENEGTTGTFSCTDIQRKRASLGFDFQHAVERMKLSPTVVKPDAITSQMQAVHTSENEGTRGKVSGTDAQRKRASLGCNLQPAVERMKLSPTMVKPSGSIMSQSASTGNTRSGGNVLRSRNSFPVLPSSLSRNSSARSSTSSTSSRGSASSKSTSERSRSCSVSSARNLQAQIAMCGLQAARSNLVQFKRLPLPPMTEPPFVPLSTKPKLPRLIEANPPQTFAATTTAGSVTTEASDTAMEQDDGLYSDISEILKSDILSSTPSTQRPLPPVGNSSSTEHDLKADAVKGSSSVADQVTFDAGYVCAMRPDPNRLQQSSVDDPGDDIYEEAPAELEDLPLLDLPPPPPDIFYSDFPLDESAQELPVFDEQTNGIQQALADIEGDFSDEEWDEIGDGEDEMTYEVTDDLRPTDAATTGQDDRHAELLSPEGVTSGVSPQDANPTDRKTLKRQQKEEEKDRKKQAKQREKEEREQKKRDLELQKQLKKLREQQRRKFKLTGKEDVELVVQALQTCKQGPENYLIYTGGEQFEVLSLHEKLKKKFPDACWLVRRMKDGTYGLVEKLNMMPEHQGLRTDTSTLGAPPAQTALAPSPAPLTSPLMSPSPQPGSQHRLSRLPSQEPPMSPAAGPTSPFAAAAMQQVEPPPPTMALPAFPPARMPPPPSTAPPPFDYHHSMEGEYDPGDADGIYDTGVEGDEYTEGYIQDYNEDVYEEAQA